MMPILIVEDDLSTAELEKRCLARSGMTARIVERVEEAVTLLKSERYSAVLLDYALPEGDPWTVVETAHRAIPRIPVIIVTGMGNEKVAAEAVHRGVEEYVTKTDDYFDRLPDIVARNAAHTASAAQLAHLAAIVNTSSDAIMSKSLEGEVLSWNPGAERIYGYRAEEILGRNVSMLSHPDDPQELPTVLGKIRRGESVSQLETVHSAKDGRRVDISLTASPIRDAEGRVVAASCISRDICERKYADSLLLAALDSTTDGMLVVDRGGRITRHNRRFLELWRIPDPLAAQGDDEQVLAFVTGQLKDPAAFIAKINELYDDPGAESFDTLEFKDGRYFERSSRPQRVGEACVGRVWSFHDVTERKRAESLLLATLEATADGILVIDRELSITTYNRRFLEMWRVPEPLAARGDAEEVLASVIDQLKEPAFYLAKVRAQFADPEQESDDIVAFKDGRVFERLSRPQRLGTDCVGRVVSFHDITKLKRVEDDLKGKIAELERLNEIMMNREERIIELKAELAALKDGRGT
jgi:PAS domain S-box-containing protein